MTYLVFPITDNGEDGKIRLTGSAKYIEKYYTKLVEQELLQYAFYDGSAKDENTFLNTIINPATLFAFIYEDPTKFPIGHAFFNSMVGYCATGHFCIFREFHKYSVEIGHDCLDTIFKVKREDGTPLITNIMGITPISNKAALKYIVKLGFEQLCILDRACDMYYKGTFEDGVLSRRA